MIDRCVVCSIHRGDGFTERHAVEWGISRLKRNRGIATHSGKIAVRYQATVTIAAINEWLLPDA